MKLFQKRPVAVAVMVAAILAGILRSEERRVGKECSPTG